jgi:hypothetical protein
MMETGESEKTCENKSRYGIAESKVKQETKGVCRRRARGRDGGLFIYRAGGGRRNTAISKVGRQPGGRLLPLSLSLMTPPLCGGSHCDGVVRGRVVV